MRHSRSFLATLLIAVPALIAPFPTFAGQATVKTDLSPEQEFARKQLVDTVLLYDRHFRIPETGQYLDSVRFGQAPGRENLSSIAATGIGLMSLAIGDRLGVIPDAEEKAEITLANLLNTNKSAGFFTQRSQSGWYHHFINGRTGEAVGGSKGIYSTIDTAILAAGTAIAGNYFAAKTASDNADAMAPVAKKAWDLIYSIDWAQSIRSVDFPGIHQVFRGVEEEIENRFWSLPFDEYVVLPCLGHAVEQMNGEAGKATEFYQEHLAEIRDLPQRAFRGRTILSTGGNKFVSHFTLQFAFYFCRSLATDPIYLAELGDAMEADRMWFQIKGQNTYPERYWGLGAGSEIVWDEARQKPEKYRYGVASLRKNPNHMMSPAIMAGFLPVEVAGLSDQTGGAEASAIVRDLQALYEAGECRYPHFDLEILWRCSAVDPTVPVRRVQGIDLSTYMLGLAAFDPAFGLEFYETYAPGAESTMAIMMAAQ
ncbi:MAG: hypothetical protein AAGF59_03350 [Pseudomonadota bacterium]